MVGREWVEELKARLPELPEERRDRFISEYSLPPYDAGLLTGSKDTADFFEEFHRANPNLRPKDISNWLLGPISAIMNASGIDISEFFRRVSPDRLAGLLALQLKGAVNMSTAKSVLEDMFKTGKSAEDIIAEQGLGQISDSQLIEEVVGQVVEANPQPVADFRVGKEQALKFLVGQVMKATKGQANPGLANKLIRKKLAEG
jgi:aspartyl-tRNA(Asn)/glutamyl-tRNA(Gln) amidotransferase subunit B